MRSRRAPMALSALALACVLARAVSGAAPAAVGVVAALLLVAALVLCFRPARGTRRAP